MWDIAFALGRVMVVATFIGSGVSKLMAIPGTAQYIASQGLPAATALAYGAALFEIVAGAMVAVGFKTRSAAAALILFTAVATYVFHDFWTMTGAQRMQNQIHFMKNIALIGALMMLMATGAGRYSVDRR